MVNRKSRIRKTSTLVTQYFEGAEENYHLNCGLVQQILEFYLVPNVYQILCQTFTHKIHILSSWQQCKLVLPWVKSSFLVVLLRILTQRRSFGLVIKVTKNSTHQYHGLPRKFPSSMPIIVCRNPLLKPSFPAFPYLLWLAVFKPYYSSSVSKKTVPQLRPPWSPRPRHCLHSSCPVLQSEDRPFATEVPWPPCFPLFPTSQLE